MIQQHTHIKQWLLLASLSIALPLQAQTLPGNQVRLMGKKVEKKGKVVLVDLDLSIAQMKLKSNRGIVLIPILANSNDTVRMPAIEIMGRKRYIYYQRTGKTATPFPAIVERRQNGEEQDILYSHVLTYEPWMKNSDLIIGQDQCGCNQTIVGENLLSTIDEVLKVKPKIVEVKKERIPVTNVKQEMGTARLQFPIGKFSIQPSLGNNESELASIKRVIDMVKNNPNVRITAITLHGYASPDGKYSLNEKLAYNRTRALFEYLKQQYPAEDKLIKMTSTAEDWEGVKRYVEENEMPAKEKVLRIINNDNLTPDEKEQAIRTQTPAAHRHLVNSLYPSLRRTDYSVSYEVVSKSWK